MSRPHFLIIGAMKAGTTTVYADLRTHPQIFFPDQKEPNTFATDEILGPRGKQMLASLYARARPDQLCGDASTNYSKRPHIGGVPERVRAVLGASVKIIYIVREPVQRIISQHHHNHAAGGVGPDVNQAVREDPRLIDYSRYAMQLEPWIEMFGREAVKIVHFEAYVADRTEGMRNICDFLRLPPVRPTTTEQVFNRTTGKPVPGSFWRIVQQSPMYRNVIRPLVSEKQRQTLYSFLFKKAPPRPDPPTPETVEYILARLSPDMQRLSRLVNSSPLWDLDAVRKRYSETVTTSWSLS